MSSRKNNKLFAFDEADKISKPIEQMFTLKLLFADNIQDVAIYKNFEEAEMLVHEKAHKAMGPQGGFASGRASMFAAGRMDAYR